jgi:hypothetical protein
MEHPAQALIALILKQPVELVKFTFPKFTISVIPPPKYIPVWFYPKVDIFIGFEMVVNFQIPPISITSAALSKGVYTGAMQKFLGSFQIDTQDASGNQIWPITGYATLYGGVSVNFLIFSGGAYAFITLEVSLGLPNVNHQRYITFEQIYWIIRHNLYSNPTQCLAWKLALNAGFGIYIRACIDYYFGEVCWTIVDWDWSFPLFSDTHIPNLILPVASPDGTIDSSHMDASLPKAAQAQINIYELYPGVTTVDKFESVYNPDSYYRPPLSLDFNNNVIRTSGTDPNLYVLYGVTSPFMFPGAGSSLKLVMNSWTSPSGFSISSDHVSPDHLPGAVVSACQLLSLVNPPFSNMISFNGIPCTTLLEVNELSTVVITGNPLTYSVGPITLSGTYLGSLNVTVQASHYIVDAAHIYGDNGELVINLPTNTYQLLVTTHPFNNSTVVIDYVPQNQYARFVGGYGRELFIFTLSNCLGRTYLVGAQNFNSFDCTIDAAHGLEAVATPNSVRQTNSDQVARIVTFASIQNQNYTLLAAPDKEFYFTLIAPVGDTFVNIYSHGNGDSVTYINITGCDGQTNIRINITDGGKHIVVIGRNGVVNVFNCPIQIVSVPGTDTTIIIHAEKDTTEHYEWLHRTSQLRVSTPNKIGPEFDLYFPGVDRLITFFGPGNNDLIMLQPTYPTEFVFAFPETTNGTNTVHIQSSHSAVLVNGTFDPLDIGLPPADDVSAAPFDDIQAPIIVVGNHNVFIIAEGKLAPEQHYLITETTLDPTDKNGHIPTFNNASTWMQMIMRENGFTLSESLIQSHFHYRGNITLWIRTGKPDDSVHANQCRAHLNVSLGAGDDVFWHNNSAPHLFCNTDVNVGKDQITLGAAISNCYVYLGDDHDGDFLNVYCENEMANIVGNRIYPTGPNADDFVVVTYWRIEDSVSVQGGGPPA